MASAEEHDQPNRVCLFCGTGTRTKEHVLPKWTGRDVTGLGPYEQAVVSIGRDGRLTRPAREWKAPDPAGLTVSGPCRRCNNGWMSQLEDSMIQLAGVLSSDLCRVLGTTEQAVLALWATKTAMLADRGLSGTRQVADDDFAFVYEKRVPPASYMIWIARTESPDYVGRMMFRVRGGPESEPHHPNSFVTTIVVQGLACQVLHSPLEFQAAPRENPTLADEYHRRLIWPQLSSISWPTDRVSEAEFPEFIKGPTWLTSRNPHIPTLPTRWR